MSSRPRRSHRRAHSLLMAAGALLATGASAADDREVIVRAIGEIPDRPLVTYLAAHARPIQILKAEHPDYATMTSAQVAAELCGVVEDGYLDALKTLNPAANIDAAAPLGEQVFSVSWPACFRVQQNVAYKILPGDNLTSIRMLKTGEFANGDGLKTYFASSGITYDDRKKLKPGLQLTLPFATLPTKVEVASASYIQFANELSALGGRRVSLDGQYGSQGFLIGPAHGTSASDQDNCTFDTDDRYPYNALEVANAYDALRAPQQTVFIAVVDNGFFGVPCTDAACPSNLENESDFSPRFPQAFFAGRYFYKSKWANIGINSIDDPLNYPDLKPADVNEVSGHGTHVAGLVLGGPTFQDFRDRLIDKLSGQSRLQLSIVAVAHGTLTLDPNTESGIATALGLMRKPTVVNMSLDYDGPEPETAFGNLVRDRSDILFVVAGGNHGKDLSRKPHYPAALGGSARSNLITVASIDSNQRLSSFSDYGAAADIAAPGCHIFSWLNAEGEDVPISGTSQATPLVTFASALLFSKMNAATPASVKNRLIVSGDLIEDPISRQRVWSGVRLSIPKALFVADDFIFFRKNGVPTAFLGHVDRFSGVTCDGDVDFDDIRALKRAWPSKFYVYTATPGGTLNVCGGALRANTAADAKIANVLTFHARARLQGAAILPPDAADQELNIPAVDLIELVRAEY